MSFYTLSKLSKAQMVHVTDHLACTDTDLVILHYPDYIEVIERQEEVFPDCEDRQSIFRELGIHKLVPRSDRSEVFAW